MNRPGFIPASWGRGASRKPFLYAWPYLPESPNGKPLGWVARYQDADGNKEIIPFFNAGAKAGSFVHGHGGIPRPLFGLWTLQRQGPLFIVEGEKDAAALHLLGLAAVTSPSGSQAAAKADWSPAVRVLGEGRRKVIVWPDNDEPGKRYAADVVAEVGIGCLCLLKPMPDIPKAGAADWLQIEIGRRGIEWDGFNLVELDGIREQLRKALLETIRDSVGTIPREWMPQQGLTAEASPDWRQAFDRDNEKPPYVAGSRGIFRVTSDGERQLCNFTASIAEEVSRDDGQEQNLALAIEGTRGGKPLPMVSLTVEQFTKMDWPLKHWGTGCMVYPGQANREHLRHAIQVLSHDGREVPRRTVYTHTGWRKLFSGWAYLSAGAVIDTTGGRADVVVDIGELGELYRLPSPSSDRHQAKEAAQASYAAGMVAPPGISVPLVAAVYLAPLAQALGVDFALWLEGPSRSMKSSLAGMLAAHFGSGINRTALTASWLDTSNAIAFKLFTLADGLAVIDDYAPQPTSGDQARLEKSVHNIVRGIGNRAGRGRLTADIRLQNERRPRALVVVTAEQWPSGESINARLFGVSVQHGDINLTRLTQAQTDATGGVLARSMADHLRRVSSDYERHVAVAKERFKEFRSKAMQTGIKGRLPEQCAFLMVGYMEAVDHWIASSVIEKGKRGDLLGAAWSTLLGLGRQHDKRILSTQPAEAFRAALSDLLMSGSAHLLDRSTQNRPNDAESYGWKGANPAGLHIGWVSEQEGELFSFLRLPCRRLTMPCGGSIPRSTFALKRCGDN